MNLRERIDSSNAFEWIDISRPIRSTTPVWPGDRAFEVEQLREEAFVLSSFTTTCHVGTHLDAPLHMDPDGVGVEGVPLPRCIGRAEVVKVPSVGGALSSRDLPTGWEPTAPRVLVRSDSHAIDEPVETGFSALTAELVHWLADRGVELVGVDTPSVDPFGSDELEAHHALLARGMTCIEGLWLADAEPGTYFLVALPMRIEGVEAAPVRAILKRTNLEF